MLYEKEKERKSEFKIPASQIYYASTPREAEDLAEDALERIRRCQDDDILVGFDTEGSIEVLQLFFRINGEEWALVFQLNRIIVNGKAPESVNRLLLLNKVSYGAKKGNEEVIDVLRMCGIPDSAIKAVRIVEVQRCFEVIELMTRGMAKALAYLEHGRYTPSFSLPINPFIPIDKQRQEDLGLKTIFKFFFREATIEKTYKMRCPLFVHWPCLLSEMTTPMLEYAGTDAAVPHRIVFTACGAALWSIGLDWTDLIETVDLSMTRNRNGPFNSGRLLDLCSRAFNTNLTDVEAASQKLYPNLDAAR